MSPLAAEAQKLKEAVERRDFGAAEASFRRYGRLVEESVASAAAPEPGRLLCKAMELLEYSRRNLRAARARIGDELAILEAQSRYYVKETPPATFRLRG